MKTFQKQIDIFDKSCYNLIKKYRNIFLNVITKAKVFISIKGVYRMNNLSYLIEQCADKKIILNSHPFPVYSSNAIEYEQVLHDNVYKQIVMELHPNHIVIILLTFNHFTNQAEEECTWLINLTEKRTIDLNSEPVDDNTINYLRTLSTIFSGI